MNSSNTQESPLYTLYTFHSLPSQNTKTEMICSGIPQHLPGNFHPGPDTKESGCQLHSITAK